MVPFACICTCAFCVDWAQICVLASNPIQCGFGPPPLLFRKQEAEQRGARLTATANWLCGCGMLMPLPRTHMILGSGKPVAWHEMFTSVPSSTVTVCVVRDWTMVGGAAKQGKGMVAALTHSKRYPSFIWAVAEQWSVSDSAVAVG